MNHRSSIAAFIILVLVAGAAFYGWMQPKPPEGPGRTAIEEQELEVDTVPSTPALVPSATERMPPVREYTLQSANAVQKCFEHHDQLRNVKIDEVLSLNNFDPSVEQVNVHFERNGIFYRAVIFNQTGESKEEAIRLFTVASDGLPEKVEVFEKWKALSTNEVLDDVTRHENISIVQKQIKQEIDQNTRLSAFVENDVVRELMITLRTSDYTRTLGCATKDGGAIDCVCR